MSFKKEDLQIVIVLYKQKLNDSVSFKSIIASNSDIEILIYDNSPHSDLNAKKYPSINYIHDDRNLGVSIAYNKGAEVAKKNEKKWLLLLDQDTLLPDNFFSNLEFQIAQFPVSHLYSMHLYNDGQLISPGGYRFKKGYLLNHINTGTNKLDNLTFLNSGLLLSTDLFYRAGGYDTKVPLYFSDFVFVNRLRKFISTFVLLPINLIHNLSSNNELDIPAFKFRYNLYLTGAFEALKSERNGYLSYYLTTFLRAVKLSVKLKDFYYVRVYLRRTQNKDNFQQKS